MPKTTKGSSEALEKVKIMIKNWLRRRKTFLGNVRSLCELGQRPRHVGQLVQVGGAEGHIPCTTRRKQCCGTGSEGFVIKWPSGSRSGTLLFIKDLKKLKKTKFNI